MPLDFSGQNLRGRSFKGQNLTGANFSYADIRGTDFSYAILKGANFTGAKAGLQKRWVVVLFIAMLPFFAVALIHLLSVSLSITQIFDINNPRSILTSAISIIFVVVYFAFTIRKDSKMGLIALTFTYIITYFGLLIIYFVFPKIFTNFSTTSTNIGIALVIAFALIIFSLYIGWNHQDKNEKDDWLGLATTALVTIRGTSFRDADLTDADFTSATLRNTNFSNANLIRTCFYESKLLKYARLDGTILTNQKVVNLLVTGNGREKSYTGVNLKGANLKGADLTKIDLKQADIRDAIFEGACLEWANLTLTQAVGTNFTNAYMTGACIEAWNVDSKTKLDNVDCRFVYLLENPKPGTDDKERRPSSGELQPGEFTKLFEEFSNTFDVIFRNGIDWQSSFKTSTKKIRLRKNKLSIEKKVYEALLKAKDDEILFHRQQNAKFIEMMIASSNQKINIYNTQENKNMTNSNDSSRKVEIGSVGGDFNASGQALNLGEMDISGTVTNAINQLPDSPEPDKPGIKELLKQLEETIKAETNLSEEDKNEALEQLKTLAEAGQNPKETTLQKAAKTAIKILKGTISNLPSAAILVETCSKILPQISQFLGLN